MEWRSWVQHHYPQYGLFDGEQEWVRIHWHAPIQMWIVLLINPYDIDDGWEDHQPTAALAAWSAMNHLDEWRKSLQKPQH